MRVQKQYNCENILSIIVQNQSHSHSMLPQTSNFGNLHEIAKELKHTEI